MDQHSALIAGAQVTITNTDTGVSTRAQTTSAGYYAAPSLIPGMYTVQVEKSGFRKYVQENVSVDALQVVGLNIMLSLGEISESVTVTSTPPVLET